MTQITRLVTGGLVDHITYDLIVAADDSNATSKKLIKEALMEMGKKKPTMTMTTIMWTISNKVSMSHRITLLKILEQILNENLHTVKAELATTLAGFAANEMTSDKEVHTDWQHTACRILISLTVSFPEICYDQIINRLPTGHIPHYFVIFSLFEFCKKNPEFMVTKLKDVFSRMMQIMTSLKQDNLRWVFSAAFGMFADAVIQTEQNRRAKKFGGASTSAQSEGFGTSSSLSASSSSQADLLQSGRGEFSEALLNLYGFPLARPTSAFDGESDTVFSVMINNWLTMDKLRLVVVESMGKLMRLMTAEAFHTHFPRLLTLLMTYVKKDQLADKIASVSALHSLVMVSLHLNPRDLAPTLPQLLPLIHSVICALPPLHSTALIFPPKQNKWEEFVNRIATGEEELTEEDVEEEENGNNTNMLRYSQSCRNGAEEDEAEATGSSSQMDPRSRFLVQPINDPSKIPIDFGTSERLSSELYGTFASIAMDHIEEVLNFLIKQIEMTSGLARAVTINIITHILNVLPAHLELKRGLIIASIASVLGDSSLCVRFAIVQLVLMLSRNNFLDEPGWEKLVGAVILAAGAFTRQWRERPPPGVKAGGKDKVGLPKPVVEPKKEKTTQPLPTAEGLSTFACDVLYEMVVHHSEMKLKLWPHLLEYIIPVQYTGALPVICAAVARLAASRKRKNGTEDILIDFDDRNNANLPKPHSIILRLITVMSDVQMGRYFAVPCLALLRVIPQTLHYSLADIVDERVPAITAFWKEAIDNAEALEEEEEEAENEENEEEEEDEEAAEKRRKKEEEEEEERKRQQEEEEKKTDLDKRQATLWTGAYFDRTSGSLSGGIGGVSQREEAAMLKCSPRPDATQTEKWEHRVAGLFAYILETIQDNDWISVLADFFNLHFGLYPSLPSVATYGTPGAPVAAGETAPFVPTSSSSSSSQQQPQLPPQFGMAPLNRSNGRRILIRLLGVSAQQTTAKDMAQAQIDTMFTRAVHSAESHRQALAEGYGLTAKNPMHCDSVFSRLDYAVRGDMVRKEKSMFSTKTVIDEHVRATIILCFGRVALSAPPSIALARIEAHVIKCLNDNAALLHLTFAKQAAITAMDCLSRAILPQRVGQQFILRDRDNYIKIVINYLLPTDPAEKDAVSSQLLVSGLGLLRKLVGLQPVVPEKLQKEIVTRLCDLYEQMDAPSAAVLSASASSSAPQRKRFTQEEAAAVAGAHSSFLVALLGAETGLSVFLRLAGYILPLTRSFNPGVRKGALSSYDAIVRAFVTQTAEQEQTQTDAGKTGGVRLGSTIQENCFKGIGTIMGLLIGRCGDTRPDVRKSGCDSVGLSLYVDHILKTDPALGFDVSPTAEIVDVAAMRKDVVAWEDKGEIDVVHPRSGEKQKYSATLSIFISSRLTTHFSQCLPVSEQIDLVHSLILCGANDPTVQGSVLSLMLAFRMIQVIGFSFPPSAVELLFRRCVDCLTPFNATLSGKESPAQAYAVHLEQQQLRENKRVNSMMGQTSSASSSSTSNVDPTHWKPSSPSIYAGSLLFSPMKELDAPVEEQLLNCVSCLCNHHPSIMFDALLSMSVSERVTQSKLCFAVGAASPIAPSSKFMRLVLSILCGAEQFETKHLKDGVHYYPLSRPQMAVNALASVLSARSACDPTAKQAPNSVVTIPTSMKNKVLEEAFLNEHLPAIVAALLIQLSTLMVCENNLEALKTVATALRGVLNHVGQPELIDCLAYPNVFKMDEVDRISESDTIEDVQKKKQAFKSGAPLPNEKDKKKGGSKGDPDVDPSFIASPPYNRWQVIADKSSFDHFIFAYACRVAATHPFIAPGVIDLAVPLLSSTFPAQRLGALALVVGMVPHLKYFLDTNPQPVPGHPSDALKDPDFASKLISRVSDALLSRTSDDIIRIRRMTLEGLSYLAPACFSQQIPFNSDPLTELQSPHVLGKSQRGKSGEENEDENADELKMQRGARILNTLAASILAAMCRGCDDADMGCARISALSLRRMLMSSSLDEISVSPMLITICVAGRNLATQRLNSPQLKCSGCGVLACLSRFGKGVSGHQYMEQMHVALPYIAVMLSDKFAQPRKAARIWLKRVSLLLSGGATQSPLVSFCTASSVFAKDTDLAKDDRCTETLYSTFAKVLITLFLERLGQFVSALAALLGGDKPPATKIAACQMVGYILEYIPKEERKRLPTEQAIKAISALLRDGNVLVKNTAARMLKPLWSY
ncbi:putative HEAT repeat domain containing protein [Monocercomonoides exilis]|uniref:putative HEAT repeat domain containing protein n=1 Tax=Monocercomonoides exilis TaxID=2049356 RepID=UPI003559CFD7|nr:putative HEAT repeat domain containing protein [Monocercomonoides exilis]|eukprot:MONOS_3321.1-p1 / transcript=MONOS_3321.1 / gene=MONOS_3321 / organism=Monocercomonoides_exilis_PA203 / gene_product=HEAT repeat domain containing protein / transcript_product=HEAT repeat domain containing protein / location=Mono_scaffold00077:70101-77180(-) / protein_length=2216 / sequence_SO=supercontig / SO=protein_coding / is_pseudo=false